MRPSIALKIINDCGTRFGLTVGSSLHIVCIAISYTEAGTTLQ